jgi:TctA family transporter
MDIFLEALLNIIDPVTLTYMVIGVGAGLMAGSIPGFTIAMAIVLTLPFTFSMPPAQGLATMISVLVGGLSGGLMSGHLDWHTGNAIFSGNDLLTAFQWRVLASLASPLASASGLLFVAASYRLYCWCYLRPSLRWSG